MLQPRRGSKKRRLTEAEISELSTIMDAAPMDKKPTIRQFARYFGVNRSSIIKSLGGWEGIQRNRPDIEPKSHLIARQVESPVKIEPFEVDVRDKMK